VADPGLSGHILSNTMTTSKNVVELGAKDLQGPGVIACPNPRMTSWNSHPKVFIDVASTGEGRCPYCGTSYRLRPGEKLHTH
jgi:uncharacterized Zn-finger protein